MEPDYPPREFFFSVPKEDWDKLNNGLLDHQLYAKGNLLKEVNLQDKVHFSTSIISKIWNDPINFYKNIKSDILIFQNGEKWLK